MTGLKEAAAAVIVRFLPKQTPTCPPLCLRRNTVMLIFPGQQQRLRNIARSCSSGCGTITGAMRTGRAGWPCQRYLSLRPTFLMGPPHRAVHSRTLTQGTGTIIHIRSVSQLDILPWMFSRLSIRPPPLPRTPRPVPAQDSSQMEHLPSKDENTNYRLLFGGSWLRLWTSSYYFV